MKINSAHVVEGFDVTGIATEYCVMATARDAVKNGFRVYTVTNAVAAVEVQPRVSAGDRLSGAR